MLHYITGNLLESNATALVNTVNTVGVMGKGIALQFKKQFPNNAKVYKKACKEKTFEIGDILVVREKGILNGEQLIINFPTKKHWRNPSEYTYIEVGLKRLIGIIEEYSIESIAIPALGSGNGGLDWQKVKQLLIRYLSNLDCEIYIYEPNAIIKEQLKKERVKLTPARAMLLSVLYDLVRNGIMVSEFAAEKICYFLQRFGAKKILNLEYKEYIYGPYSGKVRHVLYYLNGSYIKGYSRKDKKPFESLSLLMSTEIDVNNYLSQKGLEEEMVIVEKTKAFLNGYYDSFALELLSTLDYIIQKERVSDITSIKQHLNNWSPRKSREFGEERFLKLGIKKLKTLRQVNS